MRNFIAHRGNTNGPSEHENSIEHISTALYNNFDVEIDVWVIGDRLYLGHDKPQYELPAEFLQQNRDRLWIHCKNHAALFYLKDGFNVFSHDKDDHVLTSKNYIWSYPGKQHVGAICVMPESAGVVDFRGSLGICSDHIDIIRKRELKVAIIFSGRVKACEGSEEWYKTYLSTHKADVFCSINDDLDGYHQEFVEKFNVKRHNFERFVLPPHLEGMAVKDHNLVNVYKMSSMFYNIKAALKLVEDQERAQGFEYDVIWYSRVDLCMYDKDINLSGVPDDVLYIPARKTMVEGKTCVNDQMAFGNSKTMKRVYGSVFDNLRKYNDLGVTCNPETILTHHINESGCSVKDIVFNFSLNDARIQFK